MWAQPSLSALNSPSQVPVIPLNKPVPGVPHPASQHSARFAGNSCGPHIWGREQAELGPHSKLPLTQVSSPHDPQLLCPLSLARTAPCSSTPHVLSHFQNHLHQKASSRKAAQLSCLLSPDALDTGGLPVTPDFVPLVTACLGYPMGSPKGCPQGQRLSSTFLHTCVPKSTPTLTSTDLSHTTEQAADAVTGQDGRRGSGWGHHGGEGAWREVNCPASWEG